MPARQAGVHRRYRFPVPSGATTGPVIVTVGGVDSNGVSFTMTAGPSITNLSPSAGSVGTPVTVTGTNFGASQGTSILKFNGVTATPTSWGSTSITAPVPAGSTTGPVTVTVAGVISNGMTFTMNSAPTVTLTSPANGALYAAPAVIVLEASASDPGGSITKVDFYKGPTLIGTVTSPPYTFTWNGMTSGTYSLTAVATDNTSLATTSNVVNVSVGYAPAVSLTSPTSGSAFGAPASILLTASASDSDGNLIKVDFFQGNQLIGTATSSPYNFTWNNVPVGTYVLSARATDTTGFSTISTNVSITVGTGATVTLTTPTGGTTFPAPSNISLAATASDSNGTITRVEFWAGSQLMIGYDTTAPYTYSWNNVGTGVYSLTAKAIDSQNITTTSAPVTITVSNPPGACVAGSCTSYSGSGNTGYAEGTGASAVWNFPEDNVVAKDPVTSRQSVFVADTQNNRIRVIYLEGAPGQSALIAGTGTAGYSEGGGNGLSAYFNHPRGITALKDGTGTVTALFIADTDNHVIRKILPPASGQTYWRTSLYSGTPGVSGLVNGSATSSKFYYPKGIFASSSSLFYVADTSNSAIRKLDSAGASTTFVASGTIANPAGITVSATSNLVYTASNTVNTIWKITTGGSPTLIAGTAGSGSFADGTGTAARFFWPYHLSWANPSQGETLYIADNANNRIRQLLISNNQVTTPAGIFVGGYMDGCNDTAWLNAPSGVTVGPSGELYVADTSNSRIRKVDLSSPAPTGLSATAVSKTEIDLTWQDGLINEQGFKLERSTDGVNYSLRATLGANVNSYPDTGLTPNTTYSYRIYAYNSMGNTATSSIVSATTPISNPPTVSITAPANGSVYSDQATIPINVTASDSDGTVSKVEITNGGQLLATLTNSPYNWTWSNVPSGNYTLGARATDNQGVMSNTSINVIVNFVPSVTLTNPLNGASLNAPANITLTANAFDSDGSINMVEFFNGSTKIGQANNSPYTLIWNNVWAGSYSLTAKATDNRAATTTSAVVTITVSGNQAPSGNITGPSQGAIFTAPASITISASATDADGTISKVEFFQGGTKLGEDSIAPYSYNWTGVSAGTYVLTVVVADNQGGSTISTPITITVNHMPEIAILKS
ncbi:MAG: Ig-like domain-containing protein [Terriglobia bacterium]